jgi:hypothetical protein
MASFFCGLCGVVLFVAISPATQLWAQRAMPRVSAVMMLAITTLIAHAASSLLGAVLVHPFQYWNAAAVFCFGVMSYIIVFGAVYKSISLRILLDLTGRPDRTIELSEIFDQQIPAIFVERSSILIEGGLVVREGETFATAPAGLKLATRIAWVRRLFAIGDSGLYAFGPSISRTDVE